MSNYMIRKANQIISPKSKRTVSLRMLLFCVVSCILIGQCYSMQFRQNPAPDGHRCDICPTYFQKVCAFDVLTNATFIFDNHCVMDLFNCQRGTKFATMLYEHCVYFGNFAYVHGYRYEDDTLDYGDRQSRIYNIIKEPYFVAAKSG